MTTVAAPNIRKEQFENRDRGWIGVCIIDGKGDVQGKSVGPGERVWLSEAEKIVTAEAPRDPKDNPFVPQVRIREVDDGMGGIRREEYELTPLVRVTDARFVPGSDRYVPPPLEASTQAAEAFAEADGVASRASDARAEAEDRIAEGAASRDVPPPPARAAQAVAGKLGGQDRKAPAEEPPPAPAALGGENPSEEEAAVEEEHAAKVDPEVGEETGAAQAPAGDAVEGEYAAMEEVGTPDAPNANQAGPPAPWTPGSQPGSVAPPGDLT